MKSTIRIFCILVFIFSLALNLKFYLDFQGTPKYVSLNDGNTRETYESVHHIKESQKTATGKGIRVGVLDKYFGFKKHGELYSGGRDFVNDAEAFEEIGEHGKWMATTLKEVAPDVEVFALNVRTGDKGKEAEAVVNAINWAIEHDLNVLMYSAEPFDAEYREKIDRAVKKAIDHNLVTTFVHYPLAENILPDGLLRQNTELDSRTPDVRVYHFDYNVLLLIMYEKYQNILESGGQPRRGDEMPYFSISSTSPVLAGIVAMMMEVKRDLPPADYKQVLINTSREFEYKGRKYEHVVDAAKALEYLKTRAK